MQHRIIVSALHLAQPALSAWAATLWNLGHPVLSLLIGGCTAVATVGLWYRAQAAEELAEAYAPTTVQHLRDTVEPPRPLPAFPAEENPSRIRIRPLIERGPYASVAPSDAEAEDTLPSSKEAS